MANRARRNIIDAFLVARLPYNLVQRRDRNIHIVLAVIGLPWKHMVVVRANCPELLRIPFHMMGASIFLTNLTGSNTMNFTNVTLTMPVLFGGPI